MRNRILLPIFALGIYNGYSQTKTSNQTKPNIIFILTDDQRWDALGAAGNKIIQTPEIDKLANQGLYFKNAFATTPICAASRASILTGIYERTHGYTFQQDSINEEFIRQSYPGLMKKSGYYTGFYGKFGVEYPRFKQLFDECEDYDRNKSGGYYYQKIDGKVVHLTRYTGEKALEFIEHAPKDRPFCLSLSFSAPHAHDPSIEQYFWSTPFDDLYKDVDFPEPPLSADQYFNALPEFVKNGENHVRWKWRFDTPEHYQQSVKGYYRMISELDAEIGKIRRKLAASGLGDNTIIIFASDNGYFLGERKLADKWLMYEESIRIPLIVYDPKLKKPAEISDFALNIDIPATILDLAGVQIPDVYQGESLKHYLDGKKHPKKRTSIVCEHLWHVDTTSWKVMIEPSEAVRTSEWKYLRYINYPEIEELYDLKKDPTETRNLIKNEKYQAICQELKKELVQQTKKLKLTRDKMLVNQ